MAWDQFTQRLVGEVEGSATAGGWTYRLQLRYDSGIVTTEDFVAHFRATIGRNDGRRISGDGLIFADDVHFPNKIAEFHGTPTCR